MDAITLAAAKKYTDNSIKGAGTWENMPDKPFYEEKELEIVWDGTTSKDEIDLTDTPIGAKVYNVADFISAEEIIGSIFTMTQNSGYLFEFVISEDNIAFFYNEEGQSTNSFAIIQDKFAEEVNMLFSSIEVPGTYVMGSITIEVGTAGIWFGEVPNMKNTTLIKKKIQTIPSKFIPSDIFTPKLIFDINNGDDDGYIILSQEENNIINKIINSNSMACIGFFLSETDAPMIFYHQGNGVFSTAYTYQDAANNISLINVTFMYDKNKQKMIPCLYIAQSNPTEAATYGLQNRNQLTIRDVLELFAQSARDRGLL